MYIVKKKIKGKDYFYARKSVREGDKVKSVDLGYLGKTREEAEEKFKKLDNSGKIMEKEEKKTEKLKGKKENKLSIQDLAGFCKRKGFVFPSSEIYGGLTGFWDYGEAGTELFNNIKSDFWNFFVRKREDMIGIECSIISHPRTWIASGHVSSFKDIAVICKKCKKATKLDKQELGKVKCECGGEYESQGEFNLLFKTNIGALDSQEAYLRGETAQGMFLNFNNIVDTSRVKLPFGILQMGRCFRNEIAPRDFLFRCREFTIAEFEFFIHPNEKKCSLLDKEHLNFEVRLLDEETQNKGKEELNKITIGEMIKKGKLEEWHGYWLSEQLMWFKELGLNLNKLKIREHTKDELSHYSSATFDLDYEYPFGSKEVGGNANRGKYDLNQHIKESKKELGIFDEVSKKKIIPRVIEPTFGIDRVFLALICDAYTYDEKRQNIVLKLNPKLAPVKAAVFPIIKDEKYEKIAEDIVKDLKKEFNIRYDKSGSVGRRYARNDEIGTFACVTVDGDTLKDNSVTVRDRDTTEQVRIKISELRDMLRQVIINGRSILEFGRRVNTRVK